MQRIAFTRGIGKTKVRRRKGLAAFLQDRDGRTCATGRIIHRRHAHRQRRRCARVNTTVGSATVILHLKANRRVPRTVSIGHRRKHQLAQVSRHNRLIQGHIRAAQLERARLRQR